MHVESKDNDFITEADLMAIGKRFLCDPAFYVPCHSIGFESVSSLILRLVIRLAARLQPNIGFSLRRVLAVFTRSNITPPKVIRFG